MTDIEVTEMLSRTPTDLRLNLVEHCMVFQCDDCGKEFEKIIQLVGHGNGDCDTEFNNKETRACVVCGDTFEDYPSHSKKTCSKECADKLRSETSKGRNLGIGSSVQVECENCGSIFTRWKSQVDRYEHHFCSKECQSEWRKGQDAFYASGGGIIEPESLDHVVRSGWEQGVAELLVDNDIEYEYEPKKYDLGDVRYVPDFKVGEYIIEVKGRYIDSPNKIHKLKMKHSEFTTISVGAELKTDYHIPYEDRGDLIEVLQ